MFESNGPHLNNDTRDSIQHLLLLLQAKLAIYLSCARLRADILIVGWKSSGCSRCLMLSSSVSLEVDLRSIEEAKRFINRVSLGYSRYTCCLLARCLSYILYSHIVSRLVLRNIKSRILSLESSSSLLIVLRVLSKLGLSKLYYKAVIQSPGKVMSC